MSATVKVGELTATVSNGVWKSADPLFANYCESVG